MKNVKENKQDSSVVGQRVKRARMLAGLSRKDIETNHGISIHTLQSWEIGRNPLNHKKAANLVAVLHQNGVSCSVEWLLEGKGKGPSMLDADFTKYPAIDENVGNLLETESAIQKEIDFFKKNNPNSFVIMVSDDAMEPDYGAGDFVGGIKYLSPEKISDYVGYDCIIETPEGTFFRRLMKSEDKYLLVCSNSQSSVSEPVIFTSMVLSAAPVVWHRWR